MSGECVPCPHGQVCERIKRRIDGFKQHTQDCNARRLAGQSSRIDNDRMKTEMLRQRALNDKVKKPGKYKTADQMRAKAGDQSCDVRNDHSEMNINRNKRKLDLGNSVCNNGALVKPGGAFNGIDSVLSSSGGIPSFMSNPQYEFGSDANAEGSKKMKIDSEPSYIGANNSTGKMNNCNPNGVSNLSVHIVQQFSNEQQQRIETTVNVNTSINSNNGLGDADSQSVSVNVGSKDIKQEVPGQESAQNQNNFTNNMNKQNNQTEQSCENGMTSSLDFDTDLENLLQELTQESTSDYNLPQQTQPQSQAHMHEQENVNGDAHAGEQITKEFQCKTEKIDFYGSASENTGSKHSLNNNQQYFNNNNHPSFTSQSESLSFNMEKQSSPFNNANSNQQNAQANMNMSSQRSGMIGNGNMTSQHIHRLSVSVDSKFNASGQTQPQPQPQSTLHPQQTGVPNINRSTPNSVDKLRRTPEVPPRLSHPSGQTMSKSVSPSPVSYSVSHQRYPVPNFNMIGSQPAMSRSYGGTLSQNGQQVNPNTVASGMAQSSMPRSRVPMPNSSQNFAQNYASTLQRTTSGMNMAHSMSSPNMSGVPVSSCLSKAQELQKLAQKIGPTGANGQWNNNMSASVNMEASMSYNGQTMSQHQHFTADMQQSYSSYQNPNPTANTPDQPPRGNFSAASAAAQEALVASRQQQQFNGVYGNRLSHYATEEAYSSNPANAGMTAKTMYGNAGIPNPNQIQATKTPFFQRGQTAQMVRNSRPVADMNTGVNSGMTGHYGRQMDSSFSQGGMPNNTIMNGSSSVNMRLHHQSTLASNQRMVQAQRQKVFMERYQMNVNPKSVIAPNGTSLRRGPSPLSRPAIAHGQQHMPSQNFPTSAVSSRLPGNANPATMFHGNPRSVSNPRTPGMSVTQNNSMQMWNRSGNPQPQAGINKIPPYNLNSNSNAMSANMVGYSNVGGQVQRVPRNGMMNMANGSLQGGNSMPNATMGLNNTVPGNVQPNQMQSHNLGGAYSQPQNMYPAAGAVGGNVMLSSQQNQGFGVSADMTNGFENMFESQELLQDLI